MKSIMKRAWLLLLVPVLVILMSGSVMAADNLYIPEEVVIIKSPTLNSMLYPVTGVKYKNITKLKSSNKNIVTVKKTKQDKDIFIEFKPHKTGKAVVSFNYVYQGVKKTAKIPVTIKKYKNVLKTVKIGSVNYAKKFNKSQWVNLDKAVSGKLTVKCKKGWEVVSVQKVKTTTNVFKNVKTGKKVKIGKGYTLFIIVKKGDDYRDFSIEVAG